MRLQLQGILFDLDETLYSRDEAFWNWIELEAQQAPGGVKLNRAKISALDQHGHGDQEVLLEYLDSTFDWRQSPTERLERYRGGIEGAARLSPGVKESLTRIAAKFKLGLVSNGNGPAQRTKLRTLTIDALLDPIVISEEVGYRKPDARTFEIAIAKWRVPKDKVLFVGDDPVSDIQGAKAAGLHALQVGGDEGIPSIGSLEEWLAAHAK